MKMNHLLAFYIYVTSMNKTLFPFSDGKSKLMSLSNLQRPHGYLLL